jgi:hypothetical protein
MCPQKSRGIMNLSCWSACSIISAHFWMQSSHDASEGYTNLMQGCIIGAAKRLRFNYFSWRVASFSEVFLFPCRLELAD